MFWQFHAKLVHFLKLSTVWDRMELYPGIEEQNNLRNHLYSCTGQFMSHSSPQQELSRLLNGRNERMKHMIADRSLVLVRISISN